MRSRQPVPDPGQQYNAAPHDVGLPWARTLERSSLIRRSGRRLQGRGTPPGIRGPSVCPERDGRSEGASVPAAPGRPAGPTGRTDRRGRQPPCNSRRTPRPYRLPKRSPRPAPEDPTLTPAHRADRARRRHRAPRRTRPLPLLRPGGLLRRVAGRRRVRQVPLPDLPAAGGLPRRRQGAARALGRLGRRALRPGRRRSPQAAAWPSAQEPGRRMNHHRHDRPSPHAGPPEAGPDETSARAHPPRPPAPPAPTGRARTGPSKCN